MPKRLLVAVGGTGGHILPAICTTRRLKERIPGLEALFIGSGLLRHPLMTQSEFQIKEIASSTLASKNPLQFVSSFGNILQGLAQSHALVKQFKPDLAIGFGSYHGFPPLFASLVQGVPIVLHEQNSIPGKVNRFFSPYAYLTACYFPQAAQRFRGHCVETDLPLRPGYQVGTVSQEEARFFFGLHPSQPTLLVFGGSQGARVLNRKVPKAIPPNSCQVIHLTGRQDDPSLIKQTYHDHGINAYVSAFEERMDLAWQAADFAISRAGAGTVAEMIAFEVPTLLVPYALASDGHQDLNAHVMAKDVGGAIHIKEKDLPEQINPLLQQLLSSPHQLDEMRTALRKFKLHPSKQPFHEILYQILQNAYDKDKDHPLPFYRDRGYRNERLGPVDAGPRN